MGFLTNIPPKDRAEWKMIVNGTLDYTFGNFVLQMKSAQYASSIKEGELDSEKAIDELHSLCDKYSLAVKDDLIKIFKEW